MVWGWQGGRQQQGPVWGVLSSSWTRDGQQGAEDTMGRKSSGSHGVGAALKARCGVWRQVSERTAQLRGPRGHT